MQIEDEIQKGILPNPAEVDPITGEPLPQGQVYDAQTGEVRDDRKYMSMMEDFGCQEEKVVVELKSQHC